MTCSSYKGTWSFVLAKDGSIQQAPICDMVPEGTTIVRARASCLCLNLGIQ